MFYSLHGSIERNLASFFYTVMTCKWLLFIVCTCLAVNLLRAFASSLRHNNGEWKWWICQFIWLTVTLLHLTSHTERFHLYFSMIPHRFQRRLRWWFSCYKTFSFENGVLLPVISLKNTIRILMSSFTGQKMQCCHSAFPWTKSLAKHNINSTRPVGLEVCAVSSKADFLSPFRMKASSVLEVPQIIKC
jgi:hypothetical protein